MDDDLQQELEIIKKQLEEHGKILNYLKRKSRWAGIFSTIKWLVWILVFFGAWYLLTPFLNQAMATYNSFQQNVEQIQDLKDKSGLQLNTLFEKLGSLSR